MASDDFKQTGKIKFSDINNLDNESVITKTLTVSEDICKKKQNKTYTILSPRGNYWGQGETKSLNYAIDLFDFIVVLPLGGGFTPLSLEVTTILSDLYTSHEEAGYNSITLLSWWGSRLSSPDESVTREIMYASIEFPSTSTLKLKDSSFFTVGHSALQIVVLGIKYFSYI